MSDPEENVPHPPPLPGDSNDEYERMLSQHGLGQEALKPERPKGKAAATASRDAADLPDLPRPVRPAEFAWVAAL